MSTGFPEKGGDVTETHRNRRQFMKSAQDWHLLAKNGNQNEFTDHIIPTALFNEFVSGPRKAPGKL